MSEIQIVWISDSSVVSNSQTVPISDSTFVPILETFFCLKLGQKIWDTSLGCLIKNYNPTFPKLPRLVCPDFRQLGCLDLEHKSCNLMSEIGTIKCPDFDTV